MRAGLFVKQPTAVAVVTDALRSKKHEIVRHAMLDVRRRDLVPPPYLTSVQGAMGEIIDVLVASLDDGPTWEASGIVEEICARVPVRFLLDATRVLTARVWSLLRENAGDEELQAALVCADGLFRRFMDLELLLASRPRHPEEARDPRAEDSLGAELASRRAAAIALVRGGSDRAKAEPGRLVAFATHLAVAVPWQAAEAAAGAGGPVTLALRELIERRRDRGLLPLVNMNDVVLLVPGYEIRDVTDRKALARSLVTGLNPPAGAVAGMAVASDVATIGSAADEARMMARVALLVGKVDGVYEFHDMPIEALLYRCPDLATRLSRLVAPLASGGDYLLKTLVTYLERDRGRIDTANQLTIHPNTLDYRLRKIQTLTGLSPTNPSDSHRLAVALAAWRMNEPRQA